MLGFTSYEDYADLDLLADALGSPPWVASALAHLVASAAVVVLGIRLACVMGEAWTAAYTRPAATVASVGFLAVGIAGIQGASTAALLADRNPDTGLTAQLALSVLVPVANGVAITAFGALMLLVARWAPSAGLPRWFAVLSYVAGASGLVMAFAYVPAYLVLSLAWCISAAVLLRRTTTA